VARAEPEARRAPRPPPDVLVAVQDERLRYVSDQAPGWTRVRRGKSFAYLDTDGRRITDAATLARIAALAIPPAYRDVWICPLANGHLQATGRDARGRKQYRYHPRWRAVRDGAKFDRMLAFGRALPRIRRRVNRDLGLPGMPREKVLATVVRLLDATLIRVGNEEYARENGSFGLTTLRNRHVDVKGATLRFEFRGKSGIRHSVTMEDPRIARIVRQCLEIPGQELFQYLDDDGTRHAVDSADVNEWLRTAAGGEFTAKDFRTWHATVLALGLLVGRDCASARRAKQSVVEVLKNVAGRLGNTPAVCRKSYVHPELLERFLAQTLELEGPPGERALLALLERWAEPLADTLGRSIARRAQGGRKQPRTPRRGRRGTKVAPSGVEPSFAARGTR
jgi:DNA topoisomerase-1